MKSFYWLTEFIVNYDGDRYRDDTQNDRVLFYGTVEQANNEIAKRNQVHIESAIDRENTKIEDFKKKLKDIDNIIAVRNTLTPEQQKLISVDIHGRDTALLAITAHAGHVAKLREKWSPHEEYDKYWELEYWHEDIYGFEWITDEDDNIIGFKETL